MSKKGGSSHIKRLAASKYLKINRKASKFVTKPNPGRHSLDLSIALITFLKEKLASLSAKEAKKIIANGHIAVNGKVVKEPKFPLGFGDVVYIKPEDAYYRITVGKYGVISFEKISKEEANKFILKVIGKFTAKKGKIMIRLHNGSIIEGKNDIKVNDSVVLSNGKIEKVLKFEEGARCMVYKGIHAPETGKISKISKGNMLMRGHVEIKPDKGESFETVAENIIVVGA
ncbi:MAG: S4 domain-containing protein [Candidatus Micrarchaeia archaeon]|jgi:small subunit ribosomal protein S4e